MLVESHSIGEQYSNSNADAACSRGDGEDEEMKRSGNSEDER